VLLNLAVSHAVDLDAGEGHFLAGRRHALELAAVGAVECHAGRYHLPRREDVLHRKPMVGKRLREGAAELRLGLQVQRAGGAELLPSYPPKRAAPAEHRGNPLVAPHHLSFR
jgi:hypothetical protein